MEACITPLDGEEAGNGLFPHRRPRESQMDFLEDARMCASQRTHLVAHAPTGLGKTAVALTAALECVLEDGGAVLFLTSRQSQHAIAVETARSIWKRRHIGVVDLIGQEDMCLAKKAPLPCRNGGACFFSRSAPSGADLLEYPLHVQEASRACLKEGVCPYRTALEASRRAELVIADYNHLFSPTPSILERTGRRADDVLVIVDEAHNLPGRVMENYSASLTKGDIRAAVEDSSLRHFREDLSLLEDIWTRMVRSTNPRLGAGAIDEVLARSIGVDSGGLGEELSEALRRGGGGHDRLVHFLLSWGRSGQGVARYFDERSASLVVRLVDPSLITGPVFSRVRCAVVMSGTLHPPGMFADLLGIEGAVCREYLSPFPPQNRRVLVWGGVTSRFRLRSEVQYRRIALRLGEICGHVPGNVAAFFPSYDFISRVESLLDVPGRRIISERREFGKSEREAAVALLSKGGKALLLASLNGGLYEGVDFKGNLLSAVAVVGFPLPPPSPELRAYEDHLLTRFGPRRAGLYAQTYPAISKVLQACGRAIRSEEDRAALILMDDRYLLPHIRSSFPADFEATLSRKVGEELGVFFNGD